MQLRNLDNHDSYYNAKKEGIDVRNMVVINPGNPTGHVCNAETMGQIIDFCDQNNIMLIADEVYEDTVYNPEKTFIQAQHSTCLSSINFERFYG